MKARWFAIACLLIALLSLAGNGVPGQAQAVQQVDYPYYLPIIQRMPAVPASPPLATTSYYMTTLNADTVYNLGCELGDRDEGLPGKQDNVVILHFGYPRRDEFGRYGARMYSGALPATVDEIAAAVENFGYGYWDCVDSDFDSHLRIGIGTSNYPGTNMGSVTYEHGRAWAQMVNSVNSWFQNSCPRSCDNQVEAVGANDLELSWNSFDASRNWLNGYDSANEHAMYNFGAIPGCPYFASPYATCGGEGYIWTKDQVLFVIWDSNPVLPMPEIYRTDGVNAQQWYLMSVYGYIKNTHRVQFVGPMSQYQACQQRGCYTTDNTPSQAWKQLYDLLNSDGRTAGEALPNVTDIKWLGE